MKPYRFPPAANAIPHGALALVIFLAWGCAGITDTSSPNASAAPSASVTPSGAAGVTLTCDQFSYGGNNYVSPTATLRAGEILTVTICDFGSDGGYSWAEPVYEPQALALVGKDSIAPPGGPLLVGASGSSIWRFQALSAGSSTITFADRRVWEKSVAPFANVVVSVKVTPSSSSFTPLPVVTLPADATTATATAPAVPSPTVP
jgi:predicted secreted protein